MDGQAVSVLPWSCALTDRAHVFDIPICCQTLAWTDLFLPAQLLGFRLFTSDIFPIPDSFLASKVH